jgi:multimeric flavodoxin WrbA
MDISDDLADHSYSLEQLLERIVSPDKFKELTQPQPTTTPTPAKVSSAVATEIEEQEFLGLAGLKKSKADPSMIYPQRLAEMMDRDAMRQNIDPASYSVYLLPAVASLMGITTLQLGGGFDVPNIIWSVLIQPSGGGKSRAEELMKKLGGDRCQIINVAKLKIFPCEGNVSTKRGNTCGLKDAKLNDKEKNPTGNIRCWASLNNKSDEMYKVANAIFESDIVIFFGSIRWGKMNAIYTSLIERLTWLENRHTTLGESNLLKDKEVGIIAVGHNWNGEESVKLEKEVLSFFGFKTPTQLSFNWQFLKNSNDESKKGYVEEFGEFLKDFNFVESLQESIIRFKEWIKK